MDGKVVIGTELDTKSFEAQIEELEKKLDYLEKYASSKNFAPKKGTLEYKELQADIEKTKNKIIQLRKQQEELNKSHIFENIGNSIEKITKKITKWGLAVFGIRSAYMFVRQAISTLSTSNEQLAADVDYIRYALASTLQPVIEYLVKLAYTLLSYLNYILNQWFGINIFANANKGLENANKNAKELKKTLAGFDELNIISEQESEKSNVSPSMDLANLSNIPIPDWVKWIGDNKELIKTIAGSLLIFLSASKISKILSNIARLFGVSGGMGLIGLLETLLAIAAPVLIYFVVQGIEEVMQEINALNKQINQNVNFTKKASEEHQQLTKQIVEETKQQKLNNEELKRSLNYLKNNTEANGAMAISIENTKNATFKGTEAYRKLEEQQKTLLEDTLASANAFIEMSNSTEISSSAQEEFAETLRTTITQLDDAGLSTDELKQKYEEISGKKYTAVLNADTSEAESGLKRVLNFIWEIIDGFKTIDITKGNFSTGSGYAGGSGGGRGFAKGGIIYHNLPKLASGGIINQPGSGVPLGSAIGGEHGAEGVIPLTDSQQMEILGEAIGKYITVNNTIINKMNGRVISRELQVVKNESNFAFNR